MSKLQIPTVTVAVSAFNEEKNVKSFLKSVLSQKEDNFLLERILVISDGSSDNTVKLAKSFKSSKITVKNYKERTGKSTRLNEIYSTLTSDILVQSDADVVFSHPFVIRDIIQPIIKDEKAGMCGGNPEPLKGETLTERAVNCTSEVYRSFRSSVRGGNNSFSADGRLLAFRKELVKKILIPRDMISNDKYTYYSCLIQGYNYRYVESAVVYFRSPQNIKDQITQVTRFKAGKLRMSRYFPASLVKHEQYIPRILLLKNLLIQFIKHPILCSYIFIINRYCQYLAHTKEKSLGAKWAIAYTSKSLIK